MSPYQEDFVAVLRAGMASRSGCVPAFGTAYLVVRAAGLPCDEKRGVLVMMLLEGKGLIRYGRPRHKRVPYERAYVTPKGEDFVFINDVLGVPCQPCQPCQFDAFDGVDKDVTK